MPEGARTLNLLIRNQKRYPIAPRAPLPIHSITNFHKQTVNLKHLAIVIQIQIRQVALHQKIVPHRLAQSFYYQLLDL